MEEQELSRRFDLSGIQSAAQFRVLFRARKLSYYLINDRGEMDQRRLSFLVDRLQSEPPITYFGGSFDRIAQEHFLRVCLFLKNCERGQRLLNRFNLSQLDRYVEELLFFSLNAEEKKSGISILLKRAVLSALFALLRQNIGSCFATAPAILIQNEQFENLLVDLHDLIATSTLKRTTSGVEYSVPIALSWGVGDLYQIVDFSDPTVFASPSLQAVLDTIGIKKEECPSKKQSVIDFIKSAIQKRVVRDDPTLPALEKKAQGIFKAYVDHALLKVWEYTLASFADHKVEFFRWNLYKSLGFSSKEKGGIAQVIYEEVEKRLEKANQQVEKERELYNEAADRCNVTQALLRQVDSYDRARLLKREHATYLSHLNECSHLLRQAEDRSQFLGQLMVFLLNYYAQRLPDFFQEIYDPELFANAETIYEDSAAGFRLIYKMGRKEPSSWILITEEKQFIQALKSFFSIVESFILSECEQEEKKKEIEELTTLLVQHIDSPEFILSAFQRMQEPPPFSTEPSEGYRFPWCRSAGGSMSSLVKCYYGLEKELTIEQSVVETPQELLIFLLDTLKSLPYEVTKLFEKHDHLSLLMTAPNHAFLLKPGLSPFKEGWLDKGFTYTWVRDQVVEPARAYYGEIFLDSSTQAQLTQKFLKSFCPSNTFSLMRDFSSCSSLMSLPEFRNLLVHLIEEVPPSADHVDSFLRKVYPHPALLFADSNWADLYLGFVFNPGTFDLELWRLDAQGHFGFPMTCWSHCFGGSPQKMWTLYVSPQEYSGHHRSDLSWIKI